MHHAKMLSTRRAKQRHARVLALEAKRVKKLGQKPAAPAKAAA